MKIQPLFNYGRLCVPEKPCCDGILGKYSPPVQFFCAAMKHIAIKATNAPLLVGITGASGVVYGVRLLELLRACNIETHLIVSRAAQLTLAYETKLKLADV